MLVEHNQNKLHVVYMEPHCNQVYRHAENEKY